jgi:hypothetical protein
MISDCPDFSTRDNIHQWMQPRSQQQTNNPDIGFLLYAMTEIIFFGIANP